MSAPSRPVPGYLATLRAAVNAGTLAGLLLGLADGIVALTRTEGVGASAVPGCLAASVLIYGAVHAGWLVVLSPLWHRFVRERSLGARYRIAFGWSIGVGIALELYWWTRPLLFWGLPAASPERLAVGAGALAAGLVLGWLFARGWARLPRGWHLATQIAVLVCWVGGALQLVAAGDAGSARGVINERNRDLPNVLLVVVDALRQDTLSAYGHERVRTPVVDRVASEGVLFRRASAQAPFTWTSFGSLLTGKYPRRHGLMKMEPGVRMRPNVTLPWHLKGAPFAAGSAPRERGHERLHENDYVGAAFLTGTMTNGSGLIRGFDYYSEAMDGHGLVSRDSTWSRFRSELLLSLLSTKLAQRTTDYGAAAGIAKEWLRENGQKRWIALVHLYSTHTPYDPRSPFREHYCDPAYDGPVSAFYAEHRRAIESGAYPATDEERAQWPADVEQIRNLYYGGVAQADAALGEILDELRRQDVLDDTIVVVTSDHGEDLGEGGRWEHNHMYQTNLWIPLVVRWPRGLPQGVQVDAMVDSIDLVPTLCDLIGVEPPHEDDPDERGIVDGQSLLPLVRGEVDEVRRYSFAENGRFVSIHDGRYKLVVRHEDLAEGGWERMLASETAPRPRLFDLAADPAEEHDRFDERTPELDAALERLLAELRAYDARMPIPLADVVESHRDQEEEFRNLGYMDGPADGGG